MAKVLLMSRHSYETLCQRPDLIRVMRQELGLSLEQMATLLGYQGDQARGQMSNIENGRRSLTRCASRLLCAYYYDDYRPKDWPT